MRKILILFLFCYQSYAKQNSKNNTIETDFIFRMQLFKPNQFGNYSLSNSHEAKLGWGINFSFLKYNQFRLTTGLDYIQYEVKDFSRIGNYNYSNYASLYANIGYEIKLIEKIMITPSFGYGNVNIYQRTKAQDFGTQTGKEFRVGFLSDYDLNESFSIFLNTTYIITYLNINTSPEFVNYYGNAKQFQIGIGLKIH